MGEMGEMGEIESTTNRNPEVCVDRPAVRGYWVTVEDGYGKLRMHYHEMTETEIERTEKAKERHLQENLEKRSNEHKP